jgi:hypothetical protein
MPEAAQLQISPPHLRLTLDPGSSISGTLRLSNLGDTSLAYRAYVSPYQVTDSTYQADFNTETTQTQISRWINLGHTQGSLNGHTQTDLNYTVTVPTDVPDGGQYAVIFVETTGPATAPHTSGITTLHRLGALVFAQVSGTTRQDGQLIRQQIPFWQQSAPLQSFSTIANHGNADFIATYDLQVKSLLGRPRTQVTRQYTLLPGTERDVTLATTEPLPLGFYWTTQSLYFLAGQHSLTRPVLLLPPLGLAFALAILLLSGLLVWRRLRRPARQRRHSFPFTRIPPRRRRRRRRLSADWTTLIRH